MIFIIKEESEYKNLIKENLSNDINIEKLVTFNIVETDKNKYDNDIQLNTDKNLIWFAYCENSCRYDCFFLIQSLIFNHYIIKDKLQLNNQANDIFNLAQKFKNINSIDYDNGIWNFIKNNNIDKFGILDKKMDIKQEYPISNVLEF